MAGMEDMEETIITTKEPIAWDDELMQQPERYTVVYKTTAREQLMGTFFQSILSSVCTTLYTSSDCTSSAIEIILKSPEEGSSNDVDNVLNNRLARVNVALSPESGSAQSPPLNEKPSNLVQFLFIYDIKLHTKVSSAAVPAGSSMDAGMSVGRRQVPKAAVATAAALKKLSTNPRDLGISVSLFSRAFPWHFVLDRQLRIVQLGSSLLKLFSPSFIQNMKNQQSASEGCKVTEFFEFVRPDLGSETSFETVFQRLNTPFLFRLKNLPANYGSLQLASVCQLNFFLASSPFDFVIV